ncbi:MAG: type II secretion system protein [Candidatus Moranbacteria bacterium]|nr:type II secretion system protein [Candidatus Moranbacteria bacterium]
MNYKKNYLSLKRRGFTLIELLIVIAIIGILVSVVMVSLSSARTRARDGSFKMTARSIFGASTICCDQYTGSLNVTLSADVCTPAVESLYPDATKIGTVTIDQDCAGDGSFQMTITPGTENTGNCTDAVLNQNGVVSFGGC